MSQWLSWNFGPEASLPRGGRHPARPFWESQTGSFVLPLDKAVACQPPYQIGLFFKPVKFCGWSRGWCPCHPEPPARSSMEGVNSGPSCSCPTGGPAWASLCCGSPLVSLPWSGSTQSLPPSACPLPTACSSTPQVLSLPPAPQWLNSKESICQCRRCNRWGFDPCRRKWQATPVFLLGKFNGRRSLAGYIVHGVTKGWMWLSTHAKQSPLYHSGSWNQNCQVQRKAWNTHTYPTFILTADCTYSLACFWTNYIQLHA